MEIMMNDRERIGKKLAEIRSEKGYTFGSWLIGKPSSGYNLKCGKR